MAVVAALARVVSSVVELLSAIADLWATARTAFAAV